MAVSALCDDAWRTLTTSTVAGIVRAIGICGAGFSSDS
jgi:hypothetical protein